MNTILSVLMLAKDRPRLTEQAIRSLYQHTVGFELTVVDDCSEDREPILRLQRQCGFHLVLNAEPTPTGESRNKVLREKSGLIYLTDNDVYFTPFWLHRLAYAWRMKPGEVKVLGAGCHKYLGTNKSISYSNFELHYKDAISGWSWLLDHETWKRYGPFEANALGPGQSEDWAFCQRVKADGYEVASIWPEVVIHCGRTNTEGRPATGAETIVDVPGVLVE